jgi:hypothetical protein
MLTRATIGAFFAAMALVVLPLSAAAASPPARTLAGTRHLDPCLLRYPSGLQKAVGRTTLFDRQASLYQVCAGFGAPVSVTLTPAMKCAIIAAAATYAGAVVNAGVSKGCAAADIAAAFRSGRWLNAVRQGLKGTACGYFSDIFAGSVGVFVAGAASESGPGAVAVGVATYKALAAGLKLVCGGVFTGGPTEIGVRLEAKHETAVAVDVVRHGKCLKESYGHFGIKWSAVACKRITQQAIHGGAGLLRGDGRIGPLRGGLRLGRDHQADILQFAGQPDAEDQTARYEALGYNCQPSQASPLVQVGSSYCRTVFYLNLDSGGVLSTFYTGSRNYYDQHGISVGTKEGLATRDTHQPVWVGCGTRMALSSKGILTTIDFAGGHMHQTPRGDQLIGGHAADIIVDDIPITVGAFDCA